MRELRLQEIIYRGSYLFASMLFFVFIRKVLNFRVIGILFWGGLFALFVRIRWIEPQQIQIKETMIDVGFEKNVVLISDLHLGVYKSNRYLDRIIKKINNIHEEQGLDAILVAGDLINRPRDQSVEGLTELFYPFRYADIPVIAVLGNHDVQHPGPDIRKELIQALNTNGVIFLQNNAYALGDVTIVGLGSTLAGEDNVGLLEQCKAEDNIVVLAHNPDVTLKYTTSNQDLTLVGHTHCGQVRLPWVHDKLRPYYYPVSGDFDCGYNKEKNLYISAGLGEVMLPIRFRNPPTIDILRLR